MLRPPHVPPLLIFTTKFTILPSDDCINSNIKEKEVSEKFERQKRKDLRQGKMKLIGWYLVSFYIIQVILPLLMLPKKVLSSVNQPLPHFILRLLPISIYTHHL